MLPSTSSTEARPPRMWAQCSSTHMTFSSGSSMRDGINSGRRPNRSDCSATRAARFAERTEENVAIARTSVPPAVASEEIVTQSAIAGEPTVRHGHRGAGDGYATSMDADVVVLGGGFAGLVAARDLREERRSVVLLEGRDRLGGGGGGPTATRTARGGGERGGGPPRLGAPPPPPRSDPPPPHPPA